MAVIELVDFNDIKPEGKTTKKKRTRRAGKSNTPTTIDVPKTEATEPTAEETEDSAKAAE